MLDITLCHNCYASMLVANCASEGAWLWTGGADL